mgnify:FL=1
MPSASHVTVIDLRARPHRLTPHEWSPHVRRDPARIVGIVLHQWGTPVSPKADDLLRLGPVAALAERALGVPYGISVGVAQTKDGPRGVVVLAHPIERYTHASDAGNRDYLAIGVMGRHPFREEERVDSRHAPMTDVLRAAISVAIGEAMHMIDDASRGGANADHGALRLITHRQCANGPRDHFSCPGEAVLSAALDSVAVMNGAVVPNPELVLLPEFGKPWPAEWRRHLRPEPQSVLTFDMAEVFSVPASAPRPVPADRSYSGPLGVAADD